MKLWSGKGDKGKTFLCGKQLSKASDIAEALGAVDELDSFLGVARANCNDKQIESFLLEIQKQLRILMSDLANYKGAKKISDFHVKYLENCMKTFEDELPDLKNLILPGGSLLSANLQVCRAVCRRAEREAVRASKKSKLNPKIIVYLNRLSSFLFGLALLANKRAGLKEVEWK